MKTMINIKTDPEVKENAQKLAEDIGLSLSAVVNASLKQFIRDQGVHFSKAPRMSKSLEKLVAQARRDYKQGKNIAGPFTNAEDAIKYLRK